MVDYKLDGLDGLLSFQVENIKKALTRPMMSLLSYILTDLKDGATSTCYFLDSFGAVLEFTNSRCTNKTTGDLRALRR